jgi:hypothetical protein
MQLKRILTTMLCFLFIQAQAAFQATPQAILEATIQLESSLSKDVQKIQPGTPILFTAVVRNKGALTSQEGTLQIRFVFSDLVEHLTTGALFQTEQLTLPSIPPGEEITLSFKTPQVLPTIYDFVRQDWGMRRYEAIAAVNGNEQMIGVSSIVFSAYYYARPSQETPKVVPSK